MGLRLLARIMDGIIVAVVALVIAHALGVHVLHHRYVVRNGVRTREFRFNATGGSYLKLILVQLVVSALYEVLLLAYRGATLGKMAVGVKVVRLEDRTLPGLQRAATRWVIPAVPGIVPGIGIFLTIIVFLSPFFDPTKRNRGWYDRAAGTMAVRTR